MGKKKREKLTIKLYTLHEDFSNLILKIAKEIGEKVKFIGHKKGKPDGCEADIFMIFFPKHEPFSLFRLDRYGGEIFTTWDGDWYCLSKNHSSFQDFRFSDFVRDWQAHSNLIRQKKAKRKKN